MAIGKVKGSVWNSEDNIVVSVINDLANVANPEGIIVVEGHTVKHDGGGGTFKYDTSINRNTANGGTIIDSTGSGIGTGCWVREYTLSNYSLNWFGSNDLNIAALQAAYGIENATVTIANVFNGGVFIFVSSQVGDHDGVDNINGWIRQTTEKAYNVDYDNTISGLTATNVKEALDELDTGLESGGTDLQTHINNAANPHSSASITYDDSTSGLGVTNVQAAVETLDGLLDTHLEATSGAHAGTEISFANATSGLAATNVQAAIDELDGLVDTNTTTKAPLSSPAFTGVPTGPTATAGTATTQLATTAFVTAGVGASVTSSGSNVNGYYRIWSDGYIEQWGRTVASGTSSANVQVFPLAFTTLIERSCVANIHDNANGGGTITSYIQPTSLTQTLVVLDYSDGPTTSLDLDWYTIGK